MALKIAGGLVGLLIVFLIYVSSRDGNFRYERDGIINAPAEAIFPYISDLKKGGDWSPYEKKDLTMKKVFSGPDGQVGAAMEFEGNSEVGAGKVEVLKLEPNHRVEIRLTMTKPLQAENLIEYTLTPVEGGTRFTWAMSGDGGFIGKLMSVLIDCEKMVAGDFEKGIANLKTLIESKLAPAALPSPPTGP